MNIKHSIEIPDEITIGAFREVLILAKVPDDAILETDYNAEMIVSWRG